MTTRGTLIGLSLFLAGCDVGPTPDAPQSAIDRCKEFRVQSTIESYQGEYGRKWRYHFDQTVCVISEEKIAKP